MRARMDADANAGLSADDPAWIDTRQGSFYYDCTQPAAMECARLWDAMTETAAAAFPSTAWGDYLDEHGQTFNLTRLAATSAIGQLTFVATTPISIAAGTRCSSVASVTGDVITFETTDSGVTCEQLSCPDPITVDAQQTGGALAAGSRYYHVSSLNEFGESTASGDVEAVTSTNTGLNVLSWTAVDGASGYRVYCASEPSSQGGLVGYTVATSFIDDGTIAPSSAEPRLNTTSGITLPAAAVQTGSEGNVAAGAISSLDTVLANVYSVANLEPFVGGAEQESDADFRIRILGEYLGSSGGGNVGDYKRWVIGQGIPRVSVTAVWDGPGTVLVVIMERDGSPMTEQVVEQIQQFLDPYPGQGAGQAPIGATVTVMTSALIGIDIAAQVTCDDGYSLDGTGATLAVRNSILQSLSGYLNGLEPGSAVVYEHVQACFFVVGVYNIAGVTVNGTVDDVLALASGSSANYVTNGTFVTDPLTEPPGGGSAAGDWSTAGLTDWVSPGASAAVVSEPSAPGARAVAVTASDTDEGIWLNLGVLAVGRYTLAFNVNADDLGQVSVSAGQTPDELDAVDVGQTGWGIRSSVSFSSDGASASYIAFRSTAAMTFMLAAVSVRSVTVQVARLGTVTLTES